MYDDSDKSFAEPFPWYELRQRITEKCELAGIEFSASGEVTDKPPEPLEDGKDKCKLDLTAAARPKPRLRHH